MIIVISSGIAAGELFVREACAILRLAPLSPLAGGVLAGCRVFPALHDIRAKMSHPHVVAAWADDQLPLEVSIVILKSWTAISVEKDGVVKLLRNFHQIQCWQHYANEHSYFVIFT